MMGIVLILGLIAAGIITENSVFYWIAGIIGGLIFLYMVIIVTFMKRTIRHTFDQEKFNLPQQRNFPRRGRRW